MSTCCCRLHAVFFCFDDAWGSATLVAAVMVARSTQVELYSTVALSHLLGIESGIDKEAHATVGLHFRANGVFFA